MDKDLFEEKTKKELNETKSSTIDEEEKKDEEVVEKTDEELNEEINENKSSTLNDINGVQSEEVEEKIELVNVNDLINNKKFKLTLNKLLIFMLSLSCLFLLFSIIPPKKVSNNPFLIEKGSRPLIAAHRGGKNLNPENTFKAINYAYDNYNIDIIEMDLCITSDYNLILSHNLTINAYTDVEEVTGSSDPYYISEHTLEEIQQFNFGYKFKDKDSNYPYRDLLNSVSNRSEVLLENDLRVVTINELFFKYNKTDVLYIIEIKNDGALGIIAAETLAGLLDAYNVKEKVVISTFHDNVYKFLSNNYNTIYRGGSVGSVTNFVLTQFFGVNIFDSSDFACLQIPVSNELGFINLRLDSKTLIRRAHRRNISVQYWTINDKEEMRHLIKLGADVIMTDNPDVLYELLIEMGF